MDLAHLVVIVGFPLVWHVVLTTFVYLDAPKYGMSRRQWGFVAFALPLVGFFLYIFERDDRILSAESNGDPYAEGPYRFHSSRTDSESQEDSHE